MLGQRIGNYRIVKLLGAGGMGMVYEAVHDGIGGRAAIKVLRAEIASHKDATQRFFSEARAANLVAHPGIVHIFDCGYTASGTAYLTMEFLEGETLKQRLDRLHVLTVSEAFRIVRQVAAALHAAHQRSVIHRDLKPDNLMLVRDAELPGGERVKILDFGVAKISEGLGDQTRTGMVMGTPAYMAPEQCREAKLATDRSDVYSLGVILYQVLAGQPPFVGEYAGDVMAMQMMQEPPPLSQFCPRLQRQVVSFVHRLLEKKPALRPGMEEILRELSRLHDLVVGSLTQVPRPEPPESAAHNAVPILQLALPSTSTIDLAGEPTALSISPTANSPQRSVAPSISPSQKTPNVAADHGRVDRSGVPAGLPAAHTVTLAAGQHQRRRTSRVLLPGVVALVCVAGTALYVTLRASSLVTADAKREPTATNPTLPTRALGASVPSGPTSVAKRAELRPLSPDPSEPTESNPSAKKSAEPTESNPIAEKLPLRDDTWKRAYRAYVAGQWGDAIKLAGQCSSVGDSRFKCPWIVAMATCQLIKAGDDHYGKLDPAKLLAEALTSLRSQDKADLIAEVDKACEKAGPSASSERQQPPASPPPRPAIPSEIRDPFQGLR